MNLHVAVWEVQVYTSGETGIYLLSKIKEGWSIDHSWFFFLVPLTRKWLSAQVFTSETNCPFPVYVWPPWEDAGTETFSQQKALTQKSPPAPGSVQPTLQTFHDCHLFQNCILKLGTVQGIQYTQIRCYGTTYHWYILLFCIAASWSILLVWTGPWFFQIVS